MTLAETLRRARARLREAGVETPDLDARILVEHFSGTNRTDAILSPDRTLDQVTVDAVEAALDRRISGEPTHRILGYREFYGLKLKLSAGTLEPRPDTETLVDKVLPYLREQVKAGERPRILDLGTGTGAIALALLSAVPEASAVGVDISSDALATAQANAEALGLSDRFEARSSDWFSAIPEKFHAIVSNPPYIRTQAVNALSREVRGFDPERALDGGEDGLDAYRTIASQAASHLEHGGCVAVEIGFDQRLDVERLFLRAGYALNEVGVDLGGHQRVLVFSKA